MLIHQALESSAARFGRKPAVIIEDRPVCFAELNSMANQVAHGLRRSGVQKGERVAFLGANSVEFLAVHYGAAKAGAVFVPLNSLSPVPELKLLIEDARPRALIVGKSHAGFADALSSAWRDMRLCVIAGADGVDGSTPWSQWISGQADSNPLLAIAPADDYLLLYTGGTSGRPKAAVSTHAARHATSLACALEYEVSHEDVGIHCTPFFHAGTLSLGLHTKLMMGATSVAYERFSPDRYLDAVSRHNVSYLSGVPTLYQKLISDGQMPARSLSSVRKALYGGSSMPEPVQSALRAYLPGIRLFQGYGSTEAGQVSVLRPTDHLTARSTATGRALLGVELRVVDSELQDVPMHAGGELLVRSPQLMRAYHAKPELSAEKLMAGGWYRTGDVASVDEEGYVRIAGRVDDMIVTGGENVFPAEVEAALQSHPAVFSATVFDVPHPTWVSAVCAAVVLQRGCTATEPELIEHCRAQLAPYKKPKHILFVDEVPKTPIGKPDRRQLRSRFVDDARERAGK
jgi:fatty-acyl-CoA synthase